MHCDECGQEEAIFEMWGTDGTMNFCAACAPEYETCRKCACRVLVASGLISDGRCATCADKDAD